VAQPIGPDNLREYLMAFADGELAQEQRHAVSCYLCKHPESLEQFAEIQHLRAAAQRAVVASTPEIPGGLRSRIDALMSSLPSPAVEASSSPRASQSTPRRLRFSSRMVFATAGAIVLASALAFMAGQRYAANPSPSLAQNRSSFTEAASPDVLPVALTTTMTRVHVDCSRFPAHHTAQIPTELGRLSDALKQDLAADQPHPDLSKLGYRFIGAGPCGKPLETTVHFLYVSTEAGSTDTLSVFAQPAEKESQLEIGKLYVIAGADAAHPALTWRTARVFYFLVGNHARTVDRARSEIAARSKA